MKLNIYSADRKVLVDGDCLEATIPTYEGQIQILPDHADMIGMLDTGRFTIKLRDGNVLTGVITSGIFKVDSNVLTIASETLEFPNEIDVERAKRAQLISEKELQSPDYDESRFRKYELKLQRALIRQQVAALVK